MSVYLIWGSLIVTGVGVILEGISTAITGIQSTKTIDPSKRNMLLASSALVGFGTILMIIALILLFMYQTKSKFKQSKGLGIAALVFGILAVACFIPGAVLAGVLSQRYADEPIVANALKTAGILSAIGLAHLFLGYGLLYFAIGQRIKKATGKK